MEPGIFMFVLFVVGLIISAVWNQQQEQQDEYKKAELKLQAIEKRVGLAKRFLEQNFDYYQKLSEAGKAKFLARMRVVLASKRIVGQDGLVITREMQILTCAAFVQVTFGLQNFRLPRFKTIGIYPDVYHDRRLKRDLKGSTQPVGLIRFSWKHLKHGYLIPDDSINLALHELAHALKITIEKEDIQLDDSVSQELYEFVEDSAPIRSAILSGKIDAIRNYAAVNEDELFACCVEYFFENPADFKEKLPRVYDKICRILRQDTLNVEGDFAYANTSETSAYRRMSSVSGYQKVARAPLNTKIDDKAYSWTSTLMLLGILLGPLSLIIMLPNSESDGASILLFMLTLLVVGIMIFWRRLFASGYMSSFVFVAFMTFGWLFPALVSGLLLNSVVPIYSYTEVEHHPNVISANGIYLIKRSASKFAVMRNGLPIDNQLYNALKSGKVAYSIRCEMYYGLFGLKEFKSAEIVFDSGQTLAL